jgi:8-oxo-dGTP pyrophosphatase MutT (NUDIX family)
MADSTIRLAGCILTDGQGRVLLLHRSTAKRTQWEIPGGKIEPGESEAETVVREVHEELDVDVRLLRRLGSEHFAEDNYFMHYTWYLGEITSGTPAIGEPQTFDDLRYFSCADLAAMTDELSGNTVNFLAAWAEKKFVIPRDPAPDHRMPLLIAAVAAVSLAVVYLLSRPDNDD